MGEEQQDFSILDNAVVVGIKWRLRSVPGNIHVYTNQGASYSQFYQPRRRRTYERREEVVEENRSQVSESQSTRGPSRTGFTPPCYCTVSMQWDSNPKLSAQSRTGAI